MGKTSRYEEAADAYKQALEKYSGQSGWNLSLDNAIKYATNAADIARANSMSAAKTAGYGKAAQYSLANDASNAAANSNLMAGTSNAMSNNANTLSGYSTNLQNELAVNQRKWDNTLNTIGTVAGGLGSLANAGANIATAISDERLKDIIIDVEELRRKNKK